VLDRESTFADPEIVELLKTKFVPVALDQWYTRRQQDTEGEFYRKIAAQGPRNDFTRTTQGLYIADPAGKLIAFNNNRGPERIRALLHRAIAEYSPPTVEPLAAETIDRKFNPQLPDGALVLRSSAKVLSGYEPTEDRWRQIFQNAVSRDNVWVTEEEQQQLLSGRVPRSLALRIARFHLVDNTRGEPPTWRVDEVRKLEVSVEQGQLHGSIHLETDDHRRGFEAELTGAIDRTGGAITRFDILVEGQFWGTGTYTMEPPQGKFPLSIAFRLADGSDIADAIPPHASRGWLDGYLNPER
jgi:hypothetical protein